MNREGWRERSESFFKGGYFRSALIAFSVRRAASNTPYNYQSGGEF